MADAIRYIGDALPPTMKKRELEIRLQAVRGFESPSAQLEQYMTPATIAADMLFEAYSRGDIRDLKVMDLGCGTGMLSIGAALLGAGMVVGFDTDPDALRIAEANAWDLGADISFSRARIDEIEEGADTVVMNPPFGCLTPHADRPFLERALALSDCVYSIHMASTLGFVEAYCERRGRSVFWRRTYKYDIPHQFSFHSREKQTVEVAAVGIR